MNNGKSIIYRFGDYQLDVRERRLWHGTEPVPLTAKATDTLVVLLENRGRLVDKDTLLERIWPGTFVEEATLAKNISTLRKAFSAHGDSPDLIETAPRRGYRFVGPVEELIADDEVILVDHHVRRRITSTTQTVADRKRRTRKVVWTAASACALSVLILGAVYLRWMLDRPMAETRFRNIEISKLISSNNILRVAVSPDGGYLAIVSEDNGKQLVSLRQLNDSTSIPLVPPTDGMIVGVSFSIDGRRLYYTAYAKGSSVGRLYEIGNLGGTPRLIIDDVDSIAGISPDGKRFAFVRNIPSERRSAMMVATLDSSQDVREVASGTNGAQFARSSVAWMPDGGHLATAITDGDAAPSEAMRPAIIDISSGEIRGLGSTKWNWIGQVSVLADGSGVVFPAYDPASTSHTDEIWAVNIRTGAARQITNGINGAFALGLTADARRIVAVRSTRFAGMWRTGRPDVGLTLKTIEGPPDNSSLSWTPNGELLYSTATNGDLDIWSMPAGGGTEKQLSVAKGADTSAVPTADGRYVVFLSNRSGKPNIWRMRPDGTEQVQLTQEEMTGPPTIAPDGTVYFASFDRRSGLGVLKKTAVEGGTSQEVSSMPVVLPSVSPDGKTVACYLRRENRRFTIALVSATDGQILREFPNEESGPLSMLVWTRDGRAIRYIRNDSTIVEQPVAGGDPQVVLDSAPDSIFRFCISPDGKDMIYEKGRGINDVLVIADRGN